MRRKIVLTGIEYELVTTDWPFADDEARCLDVAELQLRQLHNSQPDERERVLAESITAAAADYGADNAFICQLQLRPLSELARSN